MRCSVVLSLAFVFVVTACGDDSDPGGQPDAAGTDADAGRDSGVDGPDAGGPDAAADPWMPYAVRNWSLDPTLEGAYFCEVVPVAEDLWISGFRAIATSGVARIQVSWSETAALTGEIDCNAAFFGPNMLFASGIPAAEMTFPEGVAMKVPAGSYITVQAYVVRFGPETPLDGEVGIDIQTIAQADVMHEADMFYLGTMSSVYEIPSGAPTDVYTFCSLPVDWTVFAIAPRSHRSGVHHLVEWFRGGDVFETLIDEDYSAFDQKIHPVDASIVPNNQLHITCTYENTSGYTKVLGDSWGDEQCLAAIYKYPASAEPAYFCVDS